MVVPMVNVISLDEALLRNRAWVNPEPEDQRWGRRAPPASQKHVLENLFDPQLFERNLKEVFFALDALGSGICLL